MKTITRLTTCLAILFSVVNVEVAKAQTTSGSSASNCAVSVDMVLIGEVCILGGLGLRAGADRMGLNLKPATIEEDTAVRFATENQLLPITVSTSPTKLSWIHFQFFIDFSLFNKVSIEEISSDQISKLMTNDQIDEYLDLGILSSDLTGLALNSDWSIDANISYQYITMGFLLKAPWPYFLKPFVGAVFSNESYDLDVFVKKKGAKVTFFEGYDNITEAVPIWGYEVINIEDFFIDNSYVHKYRLAERK